MIKVIIFDLDGILIDSDYIHYDTFMKAVQYINNDIYYSYDEHNKLFSSITTRNKIKLLIEKGLLKEDDIELIYNKKQEFTKEALNNLKPNKELIHLLERLKKNYKLYCCSNSNYTIVSLILDKLGIINYFEKFLTNSCIKNPKPSPEIYNTTISLEQVDPKEVLILEDSEIGLQSAYASGAHVLEIRDISEVNYENIRNSVYRLEQKGV